MKKKIFISGSRGFIGRNLVRYLQDEHYQIETLSRSDLQKDKKQLALQLEGCYGVIHLAGAPILKRWTKSYKKKIYESRILLTQNLVAAINLCHQTQEIKKAPAVFISTSAIGIYENNILCDEKNSSYGKDFLAEVCNDWENVAKQVDPKTRLCIFRMGVVLGKNGGALSSMLPAFRWGLGGKIGTGKQMLSWIHLQDVLAAYRFVLENSKSVGVYNITAPSPTPFSHLVKLLGKILHRPTFFPIPSFVLYLIFSDAASVLLDSKEVLPQRLLQENFQFQYEKLELAVEEIIKND